VERLRLVEENQERDSNHFMMKKKEKERKID
jgi:hypothetical protein